MNKTWRLKSNVKVTVFDLVGNITDIQEFPNLIMNVGLNMMRDGLYGPGGAQDLEIKRFAIGSDNTAPLVTDTQLGTETFRKARTSQSKPGTGQQTYVQYIDPSEAVGVIEEFGWFAGAAAGAAANSGIMVSHTLYSRVKTALESLQIERTDTFVEG